MIKSSGAIIYFKKKYLLQLRENKKNIYYPGFWGVFGGLLENREGYKKGLQREVKEETNLNVIASKMILSNNFIFFNHKIRKRKYFECKIIGNKKIILNEGKAFKFFSFEQIKSLDVVPLDFAAIHYHFLSIVKKKKYLP
tara:strand:- start:435 stop:854 length:420 start_codon:yes stop_codon:yes gene_type:complete